MFNLLVVAVLIGTTLGYDTKWKSVSDNQKWMNFETALEASKRRDLPIMAFFVSTDCKQCDVYFKTFDYHPQFKEIAKNFILSLLDETDVYYNMEPFDQELYAPKFAFFDSKGNLLPFDSYDNTQYKYFYSSIDMLIDAMHDVDDYWFDQKHEL
ncbi:Thioredoxin domain-containing protein [Entamoeba marina]